MPHPVLALVIQYQLWLFLQKWDAPTPVPALYLLAMWFCFYFVLCRLFCLVFAVVLTPGPCSQGASPASRSGLKGGLRSSPELMAQWSPCQHKSPYSALTDASDCSKRYCLSFQQLPCPWTEYHWIHWYLQLFIMFAIHQKLKQLSNSFFFPSDLYTLKTSCRPRALCKLFVFLLDGLEVVAWLLSARAGASERCEISPFPIFDIKDFF